MKIAPTKNNSTPPHEIQNFDIDRQRSAACTAVTTILPAGPLPTRHAFGPDQRAGADRAVCDKTAELDFRKKAPVAAHSQHRTTIDLEILPLASGKKTPTTDPVLADDASAATGTIDRSGNFAIVFRSGGHLLWDGVEGKPDKHRPLHGLIDLRNSGK
jgi:hypothetical protein